MYIKDGIAYADNQEPSIKAVGVRALDDFKLWVRFTTGEEKIFNAKYLLQTPAFQPLNNKEVFQSVYIDYGVITWQDGKIDIAPECVYENSVCIE